MPRPDPKAPGDDQDSLFEALPTHTPIHHGRHTRAVETAFAAERRDGTLTDRDEAAMTLVRAGAWSLDQFEAQNKPYGPSKVVEPILAALRELRMTPETRSVAQDDVLEGLLRDLATPTVRDPADS